MNKKVIVVIIGILFVVTLVAGILGFMNRSNGGNEELPPSKKAELVPTLKMSSETIPYENMNATLQGYEFTKQNLTMENGDAYAEIVDQKVNVTLFKDTEDQKKVVVDNVVNPKAVQIAADGPDAIILYVMDQDNYVYRVEYTIDEDMKITTKMVKFDVPNVVSFMEFTSPMAIEYYSKPYIVIKTNDNKYITDMAIADGDALTIREFVNKEVENINETTDEVPSTNEVNTEESETEVEVLTNETEEVTE